MATHDSATFLCRQGITLVRELIDAYGMEVVMAYMGHIQVSYHHDSML